MDFTKLGKVQLKIIVLGENHAEVITRASELIRNQQHFIKIHKEELEHDRENYNKLLEDVAAGSSIAGCNRPSNTSNSNNTNSESVNMPVVFDSIYS